ncbi:hypothetical protein HMPREF1155_1441 [Slackia sp. CM382]|nr:hypothetical protein HMPREF1155_1441 [Slackia sp. CM382]
MENDAYRCVTRRRKECPLEHVRNNACSLRNVMRFPDP